MFSDAFDGHGKEEELSMPCIQNIAFLNLVFIAALVALAILSLLAFVYCIREKRFADKMVAVNLIITFSVSFICLLSLWMAQDYILDVALVYAVLSFLAVIVACRQLERARIEQSREEDK